MKALNLDEERFPRRSSCSGSSPPARTKGLRPSDVEAPGRERARKVEIYAAYDEQCQREGVVDFAELMLRSYELLRDTRPCASTTSGASATSWSTSSRTPTGCSTAG